MKYVHFQQTPVHSSSDGIFVNTTKKPAKGRQHAWRMSKYEKVSDVTCKPSISSFITNRRLTNDKLTDTVLDVILRFNINSLESCLWRQFQIDKF